MYGEKGMHWGRVTESTVKVNASIKNSIYDLIIEEVNNKNKEVDKENEKIKKENENINVKGSRIKLKSRLSISKRIAEIVEGYYKRRRKDIDNEK